MCTPYMSNYYLCDFLEILDKKLEKNDDADDDVYIIYVKRYAIRNYNRLKR
jgi:hypothetical protein